MEEIWKDIKDFEDYMISNKGLVFSKKRNRLLKFELTHKGYYRVELRKNNKPKHKYVHFLVAQAFIPNDDPERKTQVNHISEVKTENTVSNLEWCDAKYNNIYGIRNKKVSEKMTNGKLSKQINRYDFDGNYIDTWPSIREIGRFFGFKCPNISACCRGKYKQAYGFKWEYAENNEEIS